ncbi:MULTISPECIES: endonuclease/exonuclease/phosphatase family protein [Bacillus]|uniref:Metal-dependent hydrolase n=1 Tax=Bacillus cereus TaxID=1396 RepID=A0A164BUP3_BACCE|nr:MULTISPECIES: endonuclease/exonuclease/phosphatase family protein [Bacillus]KZD27457.1 Metal-dependent hydrolase [Bacillus cereus]MDF2020036.1 endonuclease/exonuclease/phosphatase family protein [Bacillus sp. Cr_R3]MDF2033538.1 endonuclease/exonuclease/phosphatase family protein [Bacillus sp. Cr_R16]
MNSYFSKQRCCRRLFPAFPPAVPPIPEPQGPLTVMTWNIYLGADVTPIFTATPAQIPQRVTEVFRQFLATNFPVRVKEIANQIILKKPDIIGLQEAELWQLFVPNLPTVTYDFVELLLSELRKRGLHYEVAAQNENFSEQLPSSNGNIVGLLDRDTILIRKGSGLKIIQRQEANFQTNLTVQIGGQPFEILRGWSSIDVSANGRTFRVINTHLEPLSPPVQIAQGNELLAGPANTNLPLILLGDLNSNADGTGTPTYGDFINTGFQDVWIEVGEGPGFTCCQDPDLLNAVSSLNIRIDFILFKNGWNPIVANVVGKEQSDRTPTALWPSDHAGVVASLVLPS